MELLVQDETSVFYFFSLFDLDFDMKIRGEGIFLLTLDEENPVECVEFSVQILPKKPHGTCCGGARGRCRPNTGAAAASRKRSICIINGCPLRSRFDRRRCYLRFTPQAQCHCTVISPTGK